MSRIPKNRLLKLRIAKSRKGQAATEYIHTYGWIILSVMMLGGVIFYHNISNAKYLVPTGCDFLSGLRCIDADVEHDLLSIVVINEFGFALSNVTLNITGTCNSTANTSDGNLYGNLNVLLENKQTIYTFECQNLTGLQVDELIVADFINVNTDQRHIKIGKLVYSAE